MKISAVIPAYNSAKFIRDALTSIRQQTHPIDEIIVIDDGSTDATEAVVREAGADITYIRQENQGPSAARNRGVQCSSGDWVAFLDADDQWTPGKTAQQLLILEKHPTLHLVASDMAEIDIEDSMITPSVLAKHHLFEHFQQLDGRPVPDALAALMQNNFIPTGTVLVKRTTLLEAGLFNETIRFGEDLELWARIALNHPIACLPAVHMLRRQHDKNATGSTLPMLIDLVKVTKSIREIAGRRLNEQGLSVDKLVANALSDLGYWNFAHGDYQNARNAFKASLKERTTKRALLYRLACSLPEGLIQILRDAKQRLTR